MDSKTIKEFVRIVDKKGPKILTEPFSRCACGTLARRALGPFRSLFPNAVENTAYKIWVALWGTASLVTGQSVSTDPFYWRRTRITFLRAAAIIEEQEAKPFRAVPVPEAVEENVLTTV